MTASLKLHQSGSDGGVLVRQIHQAGLVLDGVELEEDLLVQLNPSLEDSNQNLRTEYRIHQTGGSGGSDLETGA